MNLKQVQNESAVEYLLEGRLDAVTAPHADEVLMETAESADHLILDFSGLEYISSAGLRTIKRLHMKLLKKGGKLEIKGVQPQIMDIFEVTGFTALLNFI